LANTSSTRGRFSARRVLTTLISILLFLLLLVGSFQLGPHGARRQVAIKTQATATPTLTVLQKANLAEYQCGAGVADHQSEAHGPLAKLVLRTAKDACLDVVPDEEANPAACDNHARAWDSTLRLEDMLSPANAIKVEKQGGQMCQKIVKDIEDGAITVPTGTVTTP
jgi:hypothetical protein